MQKWAQSKNIYPFIHLQTRYPAFTIVELLIVIIIIGILATLILIGYNGLTNQAKVATLTGDLTQAAKQLGIDRENAGGTIFPTSLAAAKNGNGLMPSAGATYTYYPNNTTSPTAYCLQETTAGITYYIMSAGSPVTKATAGSCIVTNGLIGWWPFNGSASDAGGAGNDGIITGAALTTGQNGQANSAYFFNGSSSYIEIPQQVPSSLSSFSISVWAEGVATAGDGFGTILHRSVDNTIGNSIYWLGINSGKYAASANGSYTQGTSATSSGATPWVNIVLTYDGTKETTYINGAQSTTYTFGAITKASSGTRTFIGSSAYSGAYRTLLGSIDDLRMYARALSTSEIQNIYSAGAL